MPWSGEWLIRCGHRRPAFVRGRDDELDGGNTQQFYLLDDAMAASYTVAEALFGGTPSAAWRTRTTPIMAELAQMPRAMRSNMVSFGCDASREG